MRLIDADALREYWLDGGSNENIYNTNDFLYELDNAPTVGAVEVVHSEWIYDGGDEYAERYHCKRCGNEIDLSVEIYNEPKPKYCGECGAKMDGGAE